MTQINTQGRLFRHLVVAVLSALLVYLFYLSYSSWGVEPALWPDWGEDHPFWRSWAHGAFVLLFLTMTLGPAARLWHPLARLIPWRRELGIWFAVLAVGHAYVIWDRWAQRDIAQLFGMEYVDSLDAYVLVRPEVGIMNMMGVIALPLILLLAVTSFDRAINVLGPSSWKHLHNSLINVIFYVLVLRGMLYLFFFFQVSPPNWTVYPSIWFLYVFLGMAIATVSLQAAAFAKTVLQRGHRKHRLGAIEVTGVLAAASLFVLPMVLAAGVVAYFDNRLLKENPALAASPDLQGEYAQNFYLVIHNSSGDVHLWVRDLDVAPYVRQSVEVEDSRTADLIYRYGDRALYTAELNAAGELTWSRTGNVSPEDLGVPEIARGPATWAALYGVGRHEISVGQSSVPVTIRIVGEVIPDDVFAVPDAASQDSASGTP